MKKLICFTFLALSIFASCNSSVDSYDENSLNIVTKESAVILTNNSKEVVSFLLLEYETSTLVDLNPDAEWPTIQAHSSVLIQYNDIIGYQESSDEAIIMWRIKNGNLGNSQKFKF